MVAAMVGVDVVQGSGGSGGGGRYMKAVRDREGGVEAVVV